MKKVRRLVTKTACWEAEEAQSFIKKMTGIEYNLTYVREMIRKWGFSMKVPVMRHVSRAGPQENCQVQEANEEDPEEGRQGVDGGRRG